VGFENNVKLRLKTFPRRESMRKRMVVSAALALAMGVASSSSADSVPGGEAAPGGKVSREAVADGAPSPDGEIRGRMTEHILAKWKGHVEEALGADAGRWSDAMAPLLAGASLDTLRRAKAAPTFDSMNDELLRGDEIGMAPSGIDLWNLGDAARDLVFVPVEPCRIIDTRIAGGAIAANSTRNFDVTAVSN
jgi:hypothetical protein